MIAANKKKRGSPLHPSERQALAVGACGIADGFLTIRPLDTSHYKIQTTAVVDDEMYTIVYS